MYQEQIKQFLVKGLSINNPFIMTCDCETTGFSEKMHDMISFSAKITDYSLDIKDEITVYARPKQDRWTIGAQKAHGFTLETALTFPDPRKTAIQLLHFLKPFKTDENDPILFVSHDVNDFDFRFFKSFFVGQMLHESFEKVFSLDHKVSTVSMGRKTGIKGNKLDVWAKRLKINLNHHEAKSDRDACFEIFKYILRNTGVQNELGIKE